MPKSIVYTTRTKEKNPTQSIERQVSSISITAGRLLAQLIKEGKVEIGTEGLVSLSLKTEYHEDIMENTISLSIQYLDEE
ncbi:MAG: hypothetical protein R3321_00200 [Nitrososphaeraceae archaeon]|nr:hypothetical protein [Nitrososphaeraceae archaeon]